MQTNHTNNSIDSSPLQNNNIDSAFIEELIALESMQDNMNYIGEILKNYIAGDYGFNVKVTLNGKDIKDESYQRLLKDYQYIKDERVKQRIKEYAEANKNDNLKIILVSLSVFLGMLFQASQMHYQHNNPEEKKDYSKEKGLGKLKKFLPRKSTLAFNGYAVLITIPFSMITSKDIGELTIDVGGGLLATLIGGYVGVKIGKNKLWLQILAPIVGAGIGAGLWSGRGLVQDIITWLNEQQIIEIDLESILENILDSIDTTQNFIPQDPFEMAFTLIYQALSIQEPKLRELISKEFQILTNETPQEIITGNLTNEEFQSLVVLLCNEKCNVNDVHSFLECSHYLDRANSTNSSLALSTPKDALPIHIKAQCFNHKKEVLAHREIYVYSPNFYSFVDRARSDENGFIEFNNACVSSKMTNSDLYFVLNRYKEVE
ncbi:QueT transporter family protein [uncultured Helicobacter sp.]|uniref:QueT transporter family protein n=1 Tax=uncultured Helicobacter sp. TaxID=175537 RepID=UPI0026375D92|nr:QueT transporter family protein [uncultured Helicobacter sp.]